MLYCSGSLLVLLAGLRYVGCDLGVGAWCMISSSCCISDLCCLYWCVAGV